MMEEMSTGGFIAVLAVGGCLAMGLIQIVGTLVRDALRSKHQEQSRRELAAYVAEGSITPADAERLLIAGQKPGQSGGCGHG